MPLLAAALLHDIGHLLYEDKDPIHEGKDGVHEDLGADYLSKYFSEEVTLPIQSTRRVKEISCCGRRWVL